MIKVIAEVLNIASAFDFGIEGDNDESAPNAVIGSGYAGEVVGVEDEGMAGGKAEGVLVFLLGEDIIGRAELLYRGVVQPCAFLHLGGNEEAFTLGFSHLGLYITTASYRQRVRRDISAVKPKDTGDGVPEGGLAVTTASVCNDEGFKENLTDGCKTANHLYIVDQLLVVTENKVEAVLPYLCAFRAGRNGGNLRNEVFGVMFLCAVESFAEVVGCCRSAEKEGIVVKVTRADFEHRARLLERGGDILGVTAVQNEFVVSLGFEVFVVSFHLNLIHNGFGFCLGRVFKYLLTAVAFELSYRFVELCGCLRKLTSRKLVSHSLCAGFCFLPVVFVVTDEVSSGGVAKFTREVLCENFRLTDIGVIFGLVRHIGIVGFRGNVSVLLADTCKKLLRRVPNGSEFLIVKWRFALGGFFEECLVCLFGVSVFLDDSACKTRHRGVTASFGNDGGGTATGHIRIEVFFQKLGKVDTALIKLHFGVGSSEEKSRGIEGVGIEVGEDAVHESFHIAVCDGICHAADWEEDVELWSRCLAVFLTHMRTAVMDGKGNTGERLQDIGGHHPIVGIFGVVVVAIHGQTIRTEEIFTVAIVVFIFGANIIVRNRSLEGFQIGYDVFVGIRAVAGVARVRRTI